MRPMPHGMPRRLDLPETKMNKLKISTRVILLVGFLGVLLVAVGGVGLHGIAASNAALKTVYEDRTVPTGQLGRIEAMLLSNRLAIVTALVTPTPEMIAASTATVERNIAAVTQVLTVYMATFLTPEEERLARQFAENRKRFVQEGLKPTLAALKANDLEEARRLAVEKVRPLYEPMEKGIGALGALQLGEARKEYAAAVARYETIRLVALTSIAAGLSLGGLLGFALVRSLSRQLGAEPDEVLAVTRAIARSDLTSEISVRKGAEDSIMAGMATMQRALAEVVGQVRASSDSIATGSAHIAAGNADLSQRTEKQACNLQQTAGSMEQLTSTVKQNADTARQASQLASGASQAASQGGRVVGQVVGTMQDISASSRKIADIVGVIDGIAFQTNILALNAAVEAARAGEQGRGFAVVASEVRSLAQRSAAAAREIKTLIGESVEKVETGARLVDDAGRSMDDIVAQVRRVTDLIAEISSAGIEQGAGIGRVGDAVAQLDHATQQNAALVEESAAAADSLAQQAARLAEVVGMFRLARGEAHHVIAQVRQASRAAPAATGPAKPFAGTTTAPTGRIDGDWEAF